MERQRYPEPTVGALILYKGKALLVSGCQSNGLYVIPGGHIETGEPMEDALRREIREETGLEIRTSRLFGVQECLDHRARGRQKHYLFIDYVCEARSNRVTLNEEHQEHRWCTPHDALELPLNAYTRRFIEEYLKGDKSRHALTVIYNYYPG